MAQRVQVILEDDIDGGAAAESVTFALDGVTYEVDLNEANVSSLRDAFAPYVSAGRRVAGRRKSGTSSRSSASKGELAKIRQWARANGHEVSDRGRISQKVRDAYARAHA